MNILLFNAALRILFLSETHSRSVQDKRNASTASYPQPTQSQLL
jgi:hypothetical protein